MAERLRGALFLAGGLTLGYLCVYGPLAAAARHEPEVSVAIKGAILCPIFIVLGLAYLILGAQVTRDLGTPARPERAALLVGGLLLVLGFGLYLGLKSKIEALGYKF